MSVEVAELATNLARNCGYAALPCREDKRPTTPHGLKDASTDPGVIAELWRKHAGPLIGIATGATSGIDVLDVDTEHEMAVRWFAAASPRIPATRTYATRRGGHHLYFRHADGVRNSQSKLALGVDVRGTGGFAIHWYSAGLECRDHSPPAPWPAWLLECVVWKPEPPPVAAPRFKSEHGDKAIDGILRVVSGAREGERNACLHWATCRLRERSAAGQIGRNEATTLLIAAARSVGLMEAEAQATIGSAWRAAS